MILDFLFPNRCLNCERIITAEEVVCASCTDYISFVTPAGNAMAEKCRLLFPVENAFALMNFEKDGLSQKILHQLKYGRREKIGRELAHWTLCRFDLREIKPDLIATIPLHPKKLRQRGYNQLHLYGNTISEQLKIPCDHELIKRNIHKPAQAKSDKAHRNSASGIFSLNKPVTGKHILLIDDVFTTGNTMASVAWEILKNENKVSILVMAVD